jgi:hypothetical protein
VKAGKNATKPAAKAAKRTVKKVAAKKAGAGKAVPASKARTRSGPPRTPAKPGGAGAPPAPVAPDRLAKLVELRLEQHAGEWSRVKAQFERVAKALQQLVVSASARPAKGGPRRFRPATSQAREYQQRMGELGTELRLLTARRAELAWVRQLLTGAAPQLPESLQRLIAARREFRP